MTTKFTPVDHRQALLDAIEKWCKATGRSYYSLAKAATGNPHSIANLIKGDIYLTTASRIFNYMEANPPAKVLAEKGRGKGEWQKNQAGLRGRPKHAA